MLPDASRWTSADPVRAGSDPCVVSAFAFNG